MDRWVVGVADIVVKHVIDRPETRRHDVTWRALARHAGTAAMAGWLGHVVAVAELSDAVDDEDEQRLVETADNL